MNQQLFEIFRDHATKVTAAYVIHPELDAALSNRGRSEGYVRSGIAEEMGRKVLEFAPVERDTVDDETVEYHTSVYVLTSDGMRELLAALDGRQA